jgi:hypothetical protein
MAGPMRAAERISLRYFSRKYSDAAGALGSVFEPGSFDGSRRNGAATWDFQSADLDLCFEK